MREWGTGSLPTLYSVLVYLLTYALHLWFFFFFSSYPGVKVGDDREWGKLREQNRCHFADKYYTLWTQKMAKFILFQWALFAILRDFLLHHFSPKVLLIHVDGTLFSHWNFSLAPGPWSDTIPHKASHAVYGKHSHISYTTSSGSVG